MSQAENKTTIRQMQASDLPLLRRLYAEVRAQLFAEQQINQNDNFDQDTKGEDVIVAMIGNQLVGFATCWSPDTFIHHLYVADNFRNQGIGSHLLSTLVQQYSQPLTLKCLVKNTKAVHFYQKMVCTKFNRADHFLFSIELGHAMLGFFYPNQ